MLNRSLMTLTIIALLAAFSPQAIADHHEADEVEKAVRIFYGQFSAGDYEAAMSHFKLGANGYLPAGLLATLASEDIRKMVVADMNEDSENGAEMRLRPEYIKVAVHGKIAIATYLIDATIRESDEHDEESQVNRGSLVWQHTDDGWKIVHWHVSKLATDDDD